MNQVALPFADLRLWHVRQVHIFCERDQSVGGLAGFLEQHGVQPSMGFRTESKAVREAMRVSKHLSKMLGH